MRERAPADWAEISAVESSDWYGHEPVTILRENQWRRVWVKFAASGILGSHNHRRGFSVHAKLAVHKRDGIALNRSYLLQHLPAPIHVPTSYPKLDDGVVKPRQVDENAVAPLQRFAFLKRIYAVKISGKRFREIDPISERIK
jgi:hypothetical protein